jgi:hypothetical protein
MHTTARVKKKATGVTALRVSKEFLLRPVRQWYQRELERLAEQLRPDFQAGRLFAWRDWSTREEELRVTPPTKDLFRRIEAHFGLEAKESGNWIEGDWETAHLILAASRYSDATDNQSAEHAVQHAADAVFWDVVVMARERGWYKPAADESAPPETTSAEVAAKAVTA